MREINRAPAAYGTFLNALAFVICGAGFAVILRTSWIDALFGGLLSLVSYGIMHWANRSRGVTALMELLASITSSILASMIAMLLPGLNPLAVALCAIICFVPGFGLTIAPYELFMSNALSGLIWLTNASVTMLKLVGGAAIRFTFAQSQWHLPATEPAAGVAPTWSWVFVPLLVAGLAFLFRVPKPDLVWVMLGAWVAWGGVQAGNASGPWQGTFLGTVALIIFANVCYRTLRLSVAAIALPGIMLLVPGVATLRALCTAQTRGITAGLESGSEVLLLIAAILAGVFVGNAVISTTKASKPRLRRRAG